MMCVTFYSVPLLRHPSDSFGKSTKDGEIPLSAIRKSSVDFSSSDLDVVDDGRVDGEGVNGNLDIGASSNRNR